MTRRFLFGLAVLLTGGLAYYFRCRGKHEPVRNWTGRYRCARCDRPLTDLVEAGLMDGSAYVPAMRRLFDREHLTVTQTGEWIQ